MTKARLLREALAQKPILKVIGAHNALGAKLAQSIGFDAVWSSGFEIATAHGVPDANILTMTENLEAAVNINTATALPVLCDCDTGYGNANNVMHMIRKYEAAGMAAAVIEDKRFPKVNSFIPGRQELASIDEFVGRIEAAKAARSSEDGIMIFARIEAFIAGWGLEEAYRRAVAYYEAGAEGLVIHSKSKEPDEVFAFTNLWNKKYAGKCPLIAIPTTYNTVTSEELAREGYKIVIYANQGMRASVRAMQEVLAQIYQEGTTLGVEGRIAPMKDLFSLQGMSTYKEHEKKFSGEAEKPAVLIPAAANHQNQPELSSKLQDKPLCMLPLAGKPLLERQLDTLRLAGTSTASVVVGFQKDKVNISGIEKIENKDYETKGSAHSVMCGLSKASTATLVCYSDILVDQQIPETLLKSEHPITLVIDQAFRTLPRRDKSLDLVLETKEDSELTVRKMRLGNFKKISKIGKKIKTENAGYEFIGMMLFSREGLAAAQQAWKEVLSEYKAKPFYEAESMDQASMTDLLQYLIDKGTEVRGLVIDHGWSELYSLEDYERLEQYFNATSNKNQDLLAST